MTEEKNQNDADKNATEASSEIAQIAPLSLPQNSVPSLLTVLCFIKPFSIMLFGSFIRGGILCRYRRLCSEVRNIYNF